MLQQGSKSVRHVNRVSSSVQLALCAALLAVVAGAQPSAGWRIDTFAGSSDVRDNGPAINAWLKGASGVAVDHAGNLYIADRYNYRVRKVDSSGIITTIAGTGERGFGVIRDGRPATETRLSWPSGVTVDGNGDLYFSVSRSNNHWVYKVDSSGIITTFAGIGWGGLGQDGPATESRLNFPLGIALDGAGSLYIADFGNHRIRKVDSFGFISTVAGSDGFSGFRGDGGPATAARLHTPHSVAVDSAGNLYIADSWNSSIRKVDISGVITTIAGTGVYGYGGDGGPATEAYLASPRGLAVDAAGNLYIADTDNHRIRVLTQLTDSSGEQAPLLEGIRGLLPF